MAEKKQLLEKQIIKRQTPENNYIRLYRKAIRTGEIVAGRELTKMLDILVEDMDSGEYVMDFTDADLRISFIEECCCIPNGEKYGHSKTLFLFQKAYISALYSFQMEDVIETDDEGNEVRGLVRRFTESLFYIGRRNAKTAFCADMADAELCIVPANNICVSSNDDEQSRLLYSYVDTMVSVADPEQQYVKRTRKRLECDNKSVMQRLSERTRNAEGRTISVAFLDECNDFPKDSKVVNSVVQSTSTITNPLLVYLTSAGFKREAFCDDLLKRARKIINREVCGDRRFLPWLYTQDETPAQLFAAADTPNGWRIWMKANPTLGKVKKVSYLRDQIEKAKNDSITRAWVLNKDFNLLASSAAGWLDYEHYTYKTEGFTLEDFRGARCIVGVDLAEVGDLTAVTLLFRKRIKVIDEDGEREELDPRFWLHTMYFVPKFKLNDNDGADYRAFAAAGRLRVVDEEIIDTRTVADYLWEVYEQYGIIPLYAGYDQRFANPFIQGMKEYGFPCEMILQNAQTLSNAIRYAEQLFRKKLIDYDSNPVLRWNIENAALQLDNQQRALIVKKDNAKKNKIDGIVSVIIAVETYLRHTTEFNYEVRCLEDGAA